MKRPAVFIDRDGTINEQMGYVNHPSRFVMLPGTAEAIRMLNQHQYLVIIISNQSGVARGYFPIDLVEKIHAHMEELLKRQGAFVDGIFFCPHYPRGSVPQYSFECNCRKPKPGLVEKAALRHDIDMKKSYVIGDRYSDIELALRLNMHGILVRTGYGRGDLEFVFPQLAYGPAHVAEDLLHAARSIIEGDGRH